MKAALPGLAAPGSVAPSKPGPAGGGTAPKQSCSGISPARGFACSLCCSPGARGVAAVCHPGSSRSSSHILGPDLRSWPLPFLCTPTTGVSLIGSPLAGWCGKVPGCLRACCKGPPLAKTCWRGRAPSLPPSQDGSLLAEKHKANVSSGLLGIFSAKSPISLERNPRLPGREEVEAGGRVAAAQLLPLTRCSRFLLAVTPASQQKGSGKAAMGVRMLFFIFFVFLPIAFITYRTLPQGLPGILALQPLPIMVASVRVSPGPPLPFLLPSPAGSR